MSRSFNHRPSPPLVVALLALFVALGGVGYAATAINGKDIKNRSVAGRKLKKNTLTGAEINESKLGKVPNATNATHANRADSATSATNAANASNATTVGGETVEKFFFKGSASTAESVILHLDGLSISAGWYFTLAVQSDGTVKSFGDNTYYEDGDGTNVDRLTPVTVAGLTNITSVSAGGFHSLALDRTGAVWAWGTNNVGQLGDGTTTNRPGPVNCSPI